MHAPRNVEARPLPDGPSRLGGLATLRWARDPLRELERYGARYGDTFTIELPGLSQPIVVVSTPDAVRDCFALGAEDAYAGKTNALLEPLLGRHSLLLLDGAEHLAQRKLIQPAFHGERMQAYGRAMLDVTHESIDAWPLGTAFPILPRMQAITLRVIVRSVLGLADFARTAELVALLSSTLDTAASPLVLFRFLQRDLGPLSPWGRFVRVRDRAKAMLREEIAAVRPDTGTAQPARDPGERTDVLAMMAAAEDETGRVLSDDELLDELMTLLVAGYETTAASLAWALRWVLPDAALLSRLREEIASAEDDPARIQRLSLLECTVKESLRLQPIFPLLGRLLLRPATIGGLLLPEDVIVSPAIHLVHQRPELYPEPQRFDPDRFVTFKPRPFEWLPFGGGLRRCIGAGFAMYEMKMVLAATLSRIDARLGTNEVGIGRRGVTLAPSGGLPIVVEQRRT
jgi:cytochrome P450